MVSLNNNCTPKNQYRMITSWPYRSIILLITIAYHTASLLMCEIGTGLFTWGFLMTYWENDIDRSTLQITSDSMALLICVIASIQNTLNHLLYIYCTFSRVRFIFNHLRQMDHCFRKIKLCLSFLTGNIHNHILAHKHFKLLILGITASVVLPSFLEFYTTSSVRMPYW